MDRGNFPPHYRSMKKRCEWCGDDPLYVAYHDEEWGFPLHDDQRLFEFEPRRGELKPGETMVVR